MYELGRGVSQNIQKAIEWHQKAANQGSLSSKESLKTLIKK